MKIRMLYPISGTGPNGRAWPAKGETCTVDDHVGARMCASGLAEPVAAKKKASKAVAKKAETRG